MQNLFFMIQLSWPCKDSFGEITLRKDKVVLNKHFETHQIFSDLHEFFKSHLRSEGVILFVLSVGALEALIIGHRKWMAACTTAR